MRAIGRTRRQTAVKNEGPNTFDIIVFLRFPEYIFRLRPPPPIHAALHFSLTAARAQNSQFPSSKL